MPRYHAVQMPVFELAPDADLTRTYRTARFPARWRSLLERQYRANTTSNRRWLPTRSLCDLLTALDPNVLYVSDRLDADVWLYATSDVDPDLLVTTVASWACTQVTADRPNVDWFELLDRNEITWQQTSLDLALHDVHPNGTSAPPTHTFNLLPTHLATIVAETGLDIRGRRCEFILGPTNSNGRRSAISWPPNLVTDKDQNQGLWSTRIAFFVAQVPLHPQPRIHAEISVTRFPLEPVKHIPRRGKDTSVTLWITAPEGFLRSSEQPTILEAHAFRRSRGPERRWSWDHGLSRALAHLTYRAYPDPNAVLANPAAYTNGDITAHVLYSEGTKLTPSLTQDDPREARDEKRQTPLSVTHPANVGFLPTDHLHAFDQLADALGPAGLVKVPRLARSSTKQPSRAKATELPGRGYVLELWTESTTTRAALLHAIHSEFGLRPASSTTPTSDCEPETVQFSGPFDLTVQLHQVGSLAAGIPRTKAKGRSKPSTDPTAHRDREMEIQNIGRSEELRAAVVELRDAAFFSRTETDDPKRTLKQGFVGINRRVQCIRPITEYEPSPTAKRSKRVVPETRFTTGDMARAINAIQDALRLAGRTPQLPTPPGITGPCDFIGLWVEYMAGHDIPMAIRLTTDGTATAVLATAGGAGLQALPATELPEALVKRHGWLNREKHDTRKLIAQFVRAVLDLDGTRDRIVLVRSATLRSRGWEWLQDKHLTPNRLVLPGSHPDDTNTPRLTPSNCPGLRIIRLRERTAQPEIPRAFAVSDDDFGRTSGLFPFNAVTAYAINPRAETIRVNKNLTKLDPDLTRHATKHGSNPNPLEIVGAFLQDHDNFEELAMYTHSLRQAALHTPIPTQFPLPLHDLSLADEFL